MIYLNGYKNNNSIFIKMVLFLTHHVASDYKFRKIIKDRTIKSAIYIKPIFGAPNSNWICMNLVWSDINTTVPDQTFVFSPSLLEKALWLNKTAIGYPIDKSLKV